MKKIRKILYILILFLGILLLSNANEVKATFEIKDINNNTITLQDIPINTNQNNYIISQRTTDKRVYLDYVLKGQYIGYDNTIGARVHYDGNRNYIAGYTYYYCDIDENNVASNWTAFFVQSYVSNWHARTHKILSGNTTLYPCFTNRAIITELPDGVSWNDKIVIYRLHDTTFYLAKGQIENQCAFGNNSGGMYYKNVVTNEIKPYELWQYGNKKWGSYLPNATMTSVSEVIYFTGDFYMWTGNRIDGIKTVEGELGDFFHLSRRLQTTGGGLEVITLETAGQIPQAMGTVLKVIIPIGLVILGIGLVIYLIKSVVLRVT